MTSLASQPSSRFVSLMEDDPLWYKRAVIYQVHVRAFHDSDGDGIGDFRGLTQKLNYLQELGVTALWLLPFYPSPLRDDGYDIADYTDVHPSYGTLRDVKEFIVEAHRRGMRVITELVLNHTSDQHRWFKRARKAPPGSNFRDFYVWSDTDDKYQSARIIFKDFETSNWAWDPVAQAYYWHRFYSHQPDLNFDNPNVHRALLRVLDFWLKLGVDGLRLDAVPYLYEREGTTCENLPETHAFLKMLRRHVDERFSNRMLLAEANQWPEDAIAYFGSADDASPRPHASDNGEAEARGDECHMAFHFPLMPRLFMSIRMEDRYPIIDILQQTPPIPDDCQWALFLRNHDELTLEMVTDEERDYMYRVYAHDRQARINLGIRRRLAPLLGNNRRKIELMNGLLFSLPGTPVIYYGDEIGMGDNVYLGDRNGVRTPMQWSGDRNAGFSRANPQRLYLPIIIDPEYHHETVNVEAQQNNPHSMLWWVRRLISLRQRYPVFGEGSLEFLYPENSKVLAFLRRSEDQTVLVVANMSRFVQCAELDLSEFKSARPVELFGGTKFPLIGQLPYFLTLGPHSFYWFELQPQRGRQAAYTEQTVGGVVSRPVEHPAITVRGDWQQIFHGRGRSMVENLLPGVLATHRWFGGKAQTIARTHVLDVISMSENDGDEATAVALVEVEYADAEPELYQVLLTHASGEEAYELEHDKPHAVVFRLRRRDATVENEILYDAVHRTRFCQMLIRACVQRRRFRSGSGQIDVQPTRTLRRQPMAARDRLLESAPAVSKADQSNTSIIYGDQAILKVYRRVAEGVNPDVEMSRFLIEEAGFPHTPKVLASIEYRSTSSPRTSPDSPRLEPCTLGVLQEYVPNEGDAWQYTLNDLSRFYEQAVSSERETVPPVPDGALVQQAATVPSQEVADVIGPYLRSAELLGQRTAQMHLALASSRDNPAFVGEPFTLHDARSLYQSWRNLTRSANRVLRRQLGAVPETMQESAMQVLAAESEVLSRFRRVVNLHLTGQRIRTHGDYHLGQVLYTGRDFVIIDFEGEPGRPVSERRMKRSPLRDVAGMLRSFEYAAHTALRSHLQRWGESTPESAERMQQWSNVWRRWVASEFLRSYFATSRGAAFLPRTSEQLQLLLDSFLLEKAIYELAYELNNRPEWVQIPLDGIVELMNRGESA